LGGIIPPPRGLDKNNPDPSGEILFVQKGLKRTFFNKWMLRQKVPFTPFPSFAQKPESGIYSESGNSDFLQ